MTVGRRSSASRLMSVYPSWLSLVVRPHTHHMISSMIKINSTTFDGKFNIKVETAEDVTCRFVKHLRTGFDFSFSVSYNAFQEGRLWFDRSEMVCNKVEYDHVMSFHST
jgi:hypothetical protein